jgi:hypothetical protein
MICVNAERAKTVLILRVPHLFRFRLRKSCARPVLDAVSPRARVNAVARTVMAFALAAGVAGVSHGQGLPEYELPPISYSETAPSDRLAKLESIPIDKRDRELLAWLLEELEVPVESQILVFSKTSLQRDLIQPNRPRALYFSDDAYVGWVPGGLIEITTSDPNLGLVFRSLDARRTTGPARLERDADCLSCHGGSMTRNWPGLMARSVFADSRGEPITSAGSFLIGHDTPIEKRWGGWYVTGRHGALRHMGNVTVSPSEGRSKVFGDEGANLDSLEKFFDPAPYLRPDSDIVALMVFEHQITVHNRLCEGGLRVRKWSHYQRRLQEELGEPVSDEPVGTALRVVNSETERIVEALLFCDEAALPEGGLSGAGDFERAFQQNQRLDSSGRSLKTLDLRQRLFRWRCSYMIYSEAFASLPAELRRSVVRRLEEILTADTPPERFGHLPKAERRGIHEILMATHPDFGGPSLVRHGGAKAPSSSAEESAE